MTYLCERYGVDAEGQPQLYAPPGSNQKAAIDSYMHWHHGNTRFLANLFQTKIRPDLKVTMDKDDNNRIQDLLERLDQGWLQSSPYIGISETPSIADILAYGELSTVTMTNLLSVDEFENVSAWMDRMALIPYHEDAHLALTTLGDLAADSDIPLAKRLGPATKAGAQEDILK
ncbi:MAG: hypothetical protein SGARI_006108 [Bacillariaceae sp.]